jgi:hypothetical protein
MGNNKLYRFRRFGMEMMNNWWRLIKEFRHYIKLRKNIDEKKVEMYMCAICGSIYLDRQSYITHYKVDACTAPMYILPGDPLDIKEKP